MPIFTQDNTDIAIAIDGLGHQRRAEEGGMIIALESWKAGLDTVPMFADLPGGACQEDHWGYVVSGAFTITYADGSKETMTAGQAYHIRPGHNAHIDQDAELVEFTRADDSPGINTVEV